MPFYYDLVRSSNTNGTTLTDSTHFWGKTIANQQPVHIATLNASARSASSGGGTVNLKTNSGTIASGGTSQTPAPRNALNRAADSVWANDASAITIGTILAVRAFVGFAQIGGPCSWIGVEPEARIQMQPNGANPIDVEVSSVAVGLTIPITAGIEFAEGI